ncbi:hypothetical protein E2562_012550 [Oryza meyeriana var. granulata]|uniref:Uncharacterized protein n=1 Tax=Oryza meyeriana var. granulata TaxID=110450 RepID=A0A6G1D4S6_9ORYZ|nr:hypothetical protein E2562_012550 [Oryza meyeriana var. granulata]
MIFSNVTSMCHELLFAPLFRPHPLSLGPDLPPYSSSVCRRPLSPYLFPDARSAPTPLAPICPTGSGVGGALDIVGRVARRTESWPPSLEDGSDPPCVLIPLPKVRRLATPRKRPAEAGENSLKAGGH